jgi:hypothetical protein
VAVPLLAPAEELSKVTLRPVLLVCPGASPVTLPPVPVTCGVWEVMAASRFSEEPSLAAVLVTLRLPLNVPMPTRAAPISAGLAALPVASRKTLPWTVTFCDARLTMQFVVQPFGVESDCNATVAVPLRAPAALASRPAIRLVLLVAPGASRLIVPLFEVAGPTAEICALRLACRGVPATLVTTNACCCRVPIRTLPKSIVVGVMFGLAGLTTVPENCQL